MALLKSLMHAVRLGYLISPLLVGLCRIVLSCNFQVGEEFVTQYYTVLRKQPHLLHRFYTEHSTVTYCEPGIEPQVIGTQQVCDAIQYRVLHASRHEYREGPVASLAQIYTLHLSRTIFRQCFTCVPDTL